MGFRLLLAVAAHYFFQAVFYLILIHVVLSWLRAYSRGRWLYHPAVMFVDSLGDRVIRPFRNLLRSMGVRTGSLDFSPMLALFAIMFLERLVLQLLMS